MKVYLTILAATFIGLATAEQYYYHPTCDINGSNGKDTILALCPTNQTVQRLTTNVCMSECTCNKENDFAHCLSFGSCGWEYVLQKCWDRGKCVCSGDPDGS